MSRSAPKTRRRAATSERGGEPLKQWEIRQALRMYQRSRENAAGPSVAEKLLSAAWELVGEQADFTLKEVADRVGIAVQSFYRHFSSKDELILAMMEESIDRGIARQTEAAGKLKDPVEQLRSLVTAPILVGFDEAGVRVLRWRARERQRLSEQFPDAVHALFEPRREAIVAAIQRAHDAGRAVSRNPELEGLVIQQLVLAMTHLQWGGVLQQTPEATADAVWRLCWDGLRPPAS